MGTAWRIPPAVGALCGAIVLGGCLHPMGEVGAHGDGAAPTNATLRGDNEDGTYRAPEVPSGSTVYVAQSEPYSAFNNATAASHSAANTAVLNQVLVDPFVVDGNGAVLLNSDVLVSAELTDQDPQTVIYRIKPGVTWSDGVAWDCSDFYLAWLIGSGTVPAQPGAARAQPGAARAECRDSLTFVETYAEPDVEWRRAYLDNVILPAHILEQATGISDITEIDSDSSPLDLRRVAHFWSTGWTGFTTEIMPASGPYRIQSSDSDGATVLVRNERWRGSPGGPERIVFVPVTDASAAVDQLRGGDLTIVAPAADAVVAERLRALTDQGVIFGSQGGAGTKVLELNLARSLLRQPEVRVALAQCVDRNMLVEDLVRGIDPLAQPQGSLAFLPGHSGYEDRYSNRMPADARRAQLTLERAGWILDQDGVYTRDGQRLTLTMSYERSVTHSRLVELLRKQCRQAGIELLDDPVDADLETVLAEGTFDLALTDAVLVPPVSSLVERYGSGGQRNYRRYANSDVDELLAQARQEYSESARVKTLRKADNLIADDLVSFPLFQLPTMWAHRDSVENVFLHRTDGITWNANEWVVR